jgi:excisionase family DNA binding protein
MGDEYPTRGDRLLTVAEVAEATGLSARGVQGRIARGSLRSLRQGDRRMVPRSEVDRLIAATGTPRVAAGQLHDGDTREVVLDLIERVQQLASENGELRARALLSERTQDAEGVREAQLEAEAERLRNELHEAHARIAALEAQPTSAPQAASRSWRRRFGRRDAAT